MFLHEHTHSMVLDLALLCIGLFFGMFLGYIAGVLHSDRQKHEGRFRALKSALPDVDTVRTVHDTSHRRSRD